MTLDVDLKNLKRVSLITIKGRVDSSNAPELESAFQTLTGKGHFRLVADLGGVEYISSAGLRLLVSTLKICRRYNRGDLRLSSLPPRIAEVFDLAGMTPLFKIFDDTVEAVGSF